MRINRSKIIVGILALLCAASWSSRAYCDRIATLKVEAGDFAREDTPITAVLEGINSLGRAVHLVEVAEDGAKAPVAFQSNGTGCRKFGESAGPESISWILSGKTAAGATRTFELEDGVPNLENSVQVKQDGKALTIEIGGSTILQYNYGYFSPPEGVEGKFIRNGYIHPVYSPSGLKVTDDFPKDHYHHKGVWFPWTNTEYEGHHVDFWNLGDETGTVRFAGFANVISGPVFGGFTSMHNHIDLTQEKPEGKTALEEAWEVRVWNVGGKEKGYWIWDLASTQKVKSSPLKMLEYRYGGLGFRGAREWIGANYKALTSEGKTQMNGHLTRAKWCDNSGAIDGKWSGVTLMDHPQNFRFPNSMRMWPTGGCFFNFSPPELGEFTIEAEKEFISQYRFFVHEGEINAEEDERRWNDFGNPPKVTVALEAAKQ